MIKTNREFAKTDVAFIKACGLVKTGQIINGEEQPLSPTIRQASKFRRGKGSAYRAMMSKRN